MKPLHVISSLEGKTPIPGHDQYFIDQQGGIFRQVCYKNKTVIIKMKSYIERYSHHEYIKFPVKSSTGNSTYRKRTYVADLLEKTFPLAYPGNSSKKLTVIRYESGSGRKPLKREQVINHLLKFHPGVQIPLTRNSEGIYDTSEGMKQLGICICEKCGHPQNVEVVVCKECGTWITKLPPRQFPGRHA